MWLARSSFSTSKTVSPRPAASRAIAQPLIPPPMIRRSKESIGRSLRHSGAGWNLPCSLFAGQEIRPRSNPPWHTRRSHAGDCSGGETVAARTAAASAGGRAESTGNRVGAVTAKSEKSDLIHFLRSRKSNPEKVGAVMPSGDALARTHHQGNRRLPCSGHRTGRGHRRADAGTDRARPRRERPDPDRERAELPEDAARALSRGPMSSRRMRRGSPATTSTPPPASGRW